MAEARSSAYIGKVQCPLCVEEGGDNSADNLAVYADEKGGYSGYCFARQHHYKHEDILEDNLIPENPVYTKTETEVRAQIDEISAYPSVESTDRRIRQEINALYGVKEKDGSRYYPLTKDGELCGYKVRRLPKDFYNIGYAKKDIDLFGQSTFKSGGKIIIVTEGEEDALASYAITKRETPSHMGYASVSVTVGKSCLDQIKNHIGYLESFEKIVFAFDQEEDALSIAREACKLFTPGKASVAVFSEKDASDMAVKGKLKEYYRAIWEAATPLAPAVVEGENVFKEYKKKDAYKGIPFLPGWGLENYRMCHPSLVVITAGTGIGKSTIIKHLQYNAYLKSDTPVGVISMEEPLFLCAGGLMSLHLQKRLLPHRHEVYTEDEERKCDEELFKSGRFIFCENTKIRTPQDLYSVVRFMANARGAKYIFLDHLTAIINKFDFSSRQSKNDYAELLINNLNDLVQELDICLVLVSHLRKTGEGSERTFETGKVPTEDDIFGSSAIKQYSALTLAAARDKTDTMSHTYIYVLKDRITGVSGQSSGLVYNQGTGWLTPVTSIEEPV